MFDFSSIGMAKAALESVNGVNLFGERGTSWSVIFIDIDAHYRNRTTFDTLLPRESASKVNIAGRVSGLLCGEQTWLLVSDRWLHVCVINGFCRPSL